MPSSGLLLSNQPEAQPYPDLSKIQLGEFCVYFGSVKNERKKKSFLKNSFENFCYLSRSLPHSSSSVQCVTPAELRLGDQKQGHDKKRSEGVARDIEVLRIQILFAHCPMPLPIEFVVLVCVFCYYLVIFDVLST